MHTAEPESKNSSEPVTVWRRLLIWAAIVPDPRSPVAKDLRTELSPLQLADVVRRQFIRTEITFA